MFTGIRLKAFPVGRVSVIVHGFCLTTGGRRKLVASPATDDAGLMPLIPRAMPVTAAVAVRLAVLARFPSYWLLAELVKRGVDGVFEQIGGRHRANDFWAGRRLDKLDHVVELSRPQRPLWMDKETCEQVPRTLVTPSQ